GALPRTHRTEAVGAEGRDGVMEASRYAVTILHRPHGYGPEYSKLHGEGDTLDEALDAVRGRLAEWAECLDAQRRGSETLSQAVERTAGEES
ncbi:unnamed protein product, partial [marine sediment metagenome]